MSDTPTPTSAAGGQDRQDRQDRGPRRDARGGPGGAREGGRKFFRRKKVCKFCVEKIDAINYKDVRLLSQFVAQPAAGEDYGECVAISKTSDATGAYSLYFFDFGPNTFLDYPHFGVWRDGYYMSAN